MAEQYLSLEEAAQRLGLSPDALNRKRETGEINAVNQGGKWQFLASDVEAVADAQVLSGDLDTDADGSGTVLGSAAESGGGGGEEVVLEASDSSVLRAEEPGDEAGASRTHIGPASPSDSAVRIETGDSGAVLDGMLDGGGGGDMQTVLGSEGLKKGAGDKITLHTSDSGIQSGAVLEGMLDSPSDGDMQTSLGSANKPGGGSGKIQLETTSDSGVEDPGLVLEGDLENAGGGPGQTVLGSASGVHEEVQVSTSEEDVFDVPGGEGASKTMLGQPSKGSQSDVQVLVKGDTGGLNADEVQLTPGKGAAESDVRLVSSGGEPTDSDVKLSPGGHEETLSLGDHADLAIDDDSMSIDLGDTESAMADEATDDTVAPEMDQDEEDITLDIGGPPDEVMDEDEDLTLTAESGGSDITISSSQSGIGVGALGGDSGLSLEQPLDLADGGGSGVDLEADDDDDEFVLSSSGSDITRRPGESGIGIGAGESGIALASLADSGISLETPLDLGGSNTGVSGVSGVGVDDGDFLLTPVDEGDEDDSEDSGSQVIALDADAEGFDEAAATMLAPEEAQGTLLEPDYGAPAPAPAPAGRQPAAGPQRMPAGMVQVQQVPVDMSVPFSGLQVTALTFCLIFLILGGMLTYDLMTNMWAHTDFQSAHYTSAIMDWILDLIEPSR